MRIIFSLVFILVTACANSSSKSQIQLKTEPATTATKARVVPIPRKGSKPLAFDYKFSQLEADSNYAKAGIHVEDILVSVDDKRIDSAEIALEMLNKVGVGHYSEMVIRRNGNEIKLKKNQ